MTNTSTQNRTAIEFIPLDIAKLSDIIPLLRESDAMLCDYTAGGLLFGMRSLYFPMIARGKHATFISVCSEAGEAREFLLPLPFSIDAVDELCEYAKGAGIPLVFSGLTEDYAKKIAEHLNTEYSVSDRLCDYVYSAPAIAALEGKQYHTQRTNIRKLKRTYGTWKYEALTEQNVDDALSFADRIFTEEEKDSSYGEAGREIVYDSLHNLDSLNLSGGILYVDGVVRGVAVGSIKQEMLYIHVLRADREIWGAWNLLCREFTSAHAGEVALVNMEDDLDDAGIRRMKSSYRPCNFIKRCRIEAK